MVPLQKSYALYLCLTSLVLAAIKILFTLRPEINLFTEEAQYWLWSQNLAWHYYSKPPLVAVLNFLSTSLMGNTELAVRSNAILSGIGIVWITYLFGSYLYSKKVGFWSAMVVQAMPMWWLASTFHMTDSSLSFFWILSIYLCYRAIHERKYKWWILAGLATAFGLLAKVVMILIFPVILLFIIYLREWNLHKTNFLKFMMISSLGFIPALIWNWQNNFDTFRHLLALSGTESINQVSISILSASKGFMDYIKGQVAVLSLFLLPVWVPAFRNSVRNHSGISLFLILPGTIAIIFFAFLSMFKEAMVNWPAFSYIGLSIILAKWVEGQTRTWKNIFLSGIFLSLSLPIFILLPDFSGIKSQNPINKTEHKVIKRVLGHQQLADRVNFLTDSLSIAEPFVFSDSYHTSSELSFYLTGNPKTYVLNMGNRRNQFDLWEGMGQFLGKDKPGIFVSWNYNTMNGKAAFKELLYEEIYTTHFNTLPRRPVHIQIWQNLIQYSPSHPTSF